MYFKIAGVEWGAPISKGKKGQIVLKKTISKGKTTILGEMLYARFI